MTDLATNATNVTNLFVVSVSWSQLVIICLNTTQANNVVCSKLVMGLHLCMTGLLNLSNHFVIKRMTDERTLWYIKKKNTERYLV